MKFDAPVRWGILGPGKIARDFLASASKCQSGRVVAVGARDPGRDGLADAFSGLRILSGYDALIADPDVDAIYVATPHAVHSEWAIRAAESGKHVLCEKPLGLSADEAEAMITAADRAGAFLGEAFMYRLHPLTSFLIDLLGRGEIGELRLIKSSFGFSMAARDPERRLLNPVLGGGAILDVGGYPASMARLLAGYRDRAPLEPQVSGAAAFIGPTGVDEWAAAVLSFPNGIVAQISCAISVAQDNVLHLQGSAGRVEIDHFWYGGEKLGGRAAVRKFGSDGRMSVLAVDEPRDVYAIQFDAANAAIRQGRRSFAYPGMTGADSLGNARLLDSWLAAAGARRPRPSSPLAPDSYTGAEASRTPS